MPAAKEQTKMDYMKEAERRLDLWKNPQEAFALAIQQGRLSRDPAAENYAGHYMYMGPTVSGNGDAFKHSLTRQYIK